jgi:hypothetical protein
MNNKTNKWSSMDGMGLYENPFYHQPNEPVSITPSGYFGDSADNIVEIENFLTPNEITFLNNFMRTNDQWDYTETKYNDEGTIIYDASYWEDRVATWNTLEKVKL